MKTFRGGLIGCGYFARNHLHGWRAVEGAELVAVCDLDRSRAEAYASEVGIKAIYTDPDEMLRAEGLDWVDIVTQPDTHRALTELAARHGVNVICQKPMAPTFADAHAMVAACRDAGVRFMIHENFRWQTPKVELKRESETLGNLFWGRISFRTPFDIYSFQPYLAEDPQFIIKDLAVHLLDLARFYLGEVDELYCVTQRVNPRIQGEDSATILLRMQSGATCVVDASYASQMEEDLFPQTLVHLEGSEGTAILGPHYALTVTRGGKTEHRVAGPRQFPWSQPPGDAVQDSVVAIQQHWVDCLREGREPDTSGADNLKTLALVYAAYRSAAERRVVSMREER